MIVKSLSRKSGIKQIIRYISTENEVLENTLLWNLKTSGKSLSSIENEFITNSRYAQRRKNGNILYHEIISFSDKDRESLTVSILLDIAEKYLAIRASHALAYAKTHFDKSNPHIHIVISANERKSKNRVRLSKSQFAAIKKELEEYQQEKYQFLENSMVKHKQQKERTTRGEKELLRKGGGDKKSTKAIIENCLIGATSLEQFKTLLLQNGFEFYERGASHGVKSISNNRKYRFTRLEIEKQYAKRSGEWIQIAERKKELQKQRDNKELSLLRKTICRKEIGRIISHNNKNQRAQIAGRILLSKYYSKKRKHKNISGH